MINRKPIFDEVRLLLGRGYSTAEVNRLDRAIDRAMGLIVVEGHTLGSLSERYESGGRGVGTVSSGKGDPGGVSYGTYQLASKTGTAGVFVKHEGSSWPELSRHAPGSAGFTSAWLNIAKREPGEFAAAQHDFIKRTHYDPAVSAARQATGIDLDKRHIAVRNAVWSVAVQHGGAAKILTEAIGNALPNNDRSLIEAIYDAREAYVGRLTMPSGTMRSLMNRYRDERRDALGMLDA